MRSQVPIKSGGESNKEEEGRNLNTRGICMRVNKIKVTEKCIAIQDSFPPT